MIIKSMSKWKWIKSEGGRGSEGLGSWLQNFMLTPNLQVSDKNGHTAKDQHSSLSVKVSKMLYI
jgi:hypothetical protein